MIKKLEALERGRSNEMIVRQLLRSASSIGSNYREASQAESRADFIHKIGICAKEAAESEYWLQLLVELNPGSGTLKDLLRESGELVRILAKSCKTAKSNALLAAPAQQADGSDP